MGRRFLPTEVRCPHRMMVIFGPRIPMLSQERATQPRGLASDAMACVEQETT
jgi:hypothetical protein